MKGGLHYDNQKLAVSTAFQVYDEHTSNVQHIHHCVTFVSSWAWSIPMVQ
jgi:hypothetical protein